MSNEQPDVVRARDLQRRDVFEHPWSGELALVEGIERLPQGKYGVTFVPYSDIGGRDEHLTLDGNLPVRTFPPVASAHPNLSADLAAQRLAPPVPSRTLRQP